MIAIIKIKHSGDEFESTYKLHPDKNVHVHNQRPNGNAFNWVGEIRGIPVRVSNDRRYASQLDIDSSLNQHRNIIAEAISQALRERD